VKYLRMDVICSLLARTTTKSPDSIHEIFDTCVVDSLPATISFQAVLMIQGTLTDLDSEYLVKVRVLDQDAAVIWQLRSSVVMELAERSSGTHPCMCASVKVNPVISGYGSYLVVFELNNEVIRHLPLIVRPS